MNEYVWSNCRKGTDKKKNYSNRRKFAAVSLSRPQDKRELEQDELNVVHFPCNYIICVQFKTNLLYKTFVC